MRKDETISPIRHKRMNVFAVISQPGRLGTCFRTSLIQNVFTHVGSRSGHMRRLLPLTICVLLGFAGHVIARQDIDVEIKPNKPVAPRPTLPTGPKRARVISKGVLFVLTDPPDAEVVVKDSRGVVRSGRSKGGQFREELPGGKYEIEVAAKGYVTYKSEVPVAIKPPGFEV